MKTEGARRPAVGGGLQRPRRVTLFVQCLVDAVYPRVAEAMVDLLVRLGVNVDCPAEQTCCGQPAYNAGYHRAARTAARHFIEVFEGSGEILCPSGSCTHMVRHHYPALFAGDPVWQRRAEAVAGRTWELSQYLVDVLGTGDVGARFDGTVVFHDSCHALRGLGIRDQPRRLIAGVRGARLVEMPDADRCCGFGGTFGAKYPEISTALVDDKVDNILASGAEAVVGLDMGCLMNIQGRLSRRGAAVRVLHLAQLLAG